MTTFDFCCYFGIDFTPCSDVFIVELELAITGWVEFYAEVI